jgi:hypothetical protein
MSAEGGLWPFPMVRTLILQEIGADPFSQVLAASVMLDGHLFDEIKEPQALRDSGFKRLKELAAQ